MATKSHNTLTTTQLHEPKGIDAAAKHDLYFADGAGSGGMAGIFEGKLYHLSYEVASGTNGGTATSGSWHTRPLNTERVADLTGASIAANVITLPAGTYWCQGYGQFTATSYSQLRLRNTTDSATLVVGQTLEAHTGSVNVSGMGTIQGKFTIATSKSVELQYFVNTTVSSTGLGAPATTGEVEVYAELWFRLIGP